ncbi:MAG: terpene cyclase/mutase family protein [Verrucomicrobiae bacterium]|nr:terpene cyclase/mutase family protein [Verrucomicrobiae bacterium]
MNGSLCRVGAIFIALLSSVPATGRADEDIDQAISRGIGFLVADQNENGSWGSARQTKGLNIYAPVPGAHDAFRAAVTAMAVSALCDSGLAETEGPARTALEKGEVYLLEHLPRIRRATADAIYNVWTHAYGIQALVDLYERNSDAGKRKTYVDLINGQIDLLGRYESVDGGWGYYDFRVGTAKPSSDSISFTTATCLVAFREASALPGVVLPQALVDRAIDSIERQQKDDFSYLYGEYLDAVPMRGINRPGGSLGRSQACNHALRIWGDTTITDEVLEDWLVRLRDRNGWLDIGRKRPIPHEAWFQVAGYFYYYGHYYASRCVSLLPREKRPPYYRLVADLILSKQETDGSWWDFPFYTYHQPYGTSFAVMTLARCRENGFSF